MTDNFYALVLKPDGKLIYNKWVYDEKLGEGHYDEIDVTNEPYDYVDESIMIEDGATLDHLFIIVSYSTPLFSLMYKDCFIEDWVKHWFKIKKNYTKPVYEYSEDGMEYLELYWHAELYDGYIEGGNFPILHGLGWQLKEDKFESWDKETPAWKMGDRIPWGISFSELDTMLHIPLKLNEDYHVWKDLADWYPDMSKDDRIAFSCKKKYALSDLIRGVFWELSFYGSPEDMRDQKSIIDGRMKDLDLDNNTVDELIAKGKLVPFREEINDGYINDGEGWRLND